MFLKILRYIIIFSTIIVGLAFNESNSENFEFNILQTKSLEMLRYMNKSADPCEDFYAYTCGNYGKYHSTNTSTSVLDALEESMKTKIQLELERDDPNDTDSDKKLKIFYRSCLKAPQLKDVYKDKLIDAIKEFGQMPVLFDDQWQEINFDWRQVLSQIFYKTGKSIIFSLAYIAYEEDKTKNSLILQEAPFALKDKSLYISAEISSERQKLQKHVAFNLQQFLGVEKDLAQQTAEEILQFESALALKACDEKLENSCSISTPTIDELATLYITDCDFKKFISEALGFSAPKVFVQSHYVENALELLRKTPKQQVANYIFYNYISNFMYYLKEPTNTLEKYCLENTKEFFYKNLVNLAYRKYFGEHSKEGIFFMWPKLKSAFEKVLRSTTEDWMSEDSRQQAVQKLKNLKLEILSYEDQNFSQELSELNLTHNDYVYNIKSLLTLRGQQFRNKFNVTAEMPILTSFLPFYMNRENTIIMPVSILQPNYVWSSSFPHAYNFASLGIFIAHEIIHGFDNRGHVIDSHGNIHDWWDTQTTEEFYKLVKCFHDQYQGYSFGERPLPELEAQTENIADNGGLRLAYQSYLKWYEEEDIENDVKKLDLITFPDFRNYTYRQLFFISYSQSLCATTHPDYMAAHAASDIHVPEKFRVIGPLSNFEEFSKEFKCPRGSGMNPFKKCRIY